MLKKRFLICLALLVALLVANLVMIQAASSSDLTFTLNDDGTGYVVTKCSTSATGTISIPATYNGKPVVEIGREAFLNCTKLTSVTIPSSVKTIGWYSFSGCTGLTSVTIPDSVTTIDWFAFSGCTSLTSINVGNGVTEVGSAAFAGCSNLNSVTLGNNVTTIGWSTFKGCAKLSNINIPNSAKSIVRYAFYSCNNLSSVTYCGTEDEWNKIVVGNANTALTGATLNLHNMVDGVCSICQYTDSCNHVASQAVKENVKAATCEAAGSYDSVVYCSKCEKVAIPFALEEPAHVHNMEQTSAAVDPTCETAGKTAVLTCTICGATEGGEEIPTTGHTDNDSNGVCDLCGSIEQHDCTPGDVLIENLLESTWDSVGRYDEVTYCTICGEELSRETKAALLNPFYSNAMELNCQLTLNFVIKWDTLPVTGGNAIKESGYYAIVTRTDANGSRVETVIPASDWQTHTKNRMRIPFSDWAPKQMSDALEVVIYNNNDEQISVAYETSVRAIAMSELEQYIALGGYDTYVTLLVDMLNYGAESQNNFKYNTSDLANALLPDAWKAYATPDVSYGARKDNSSVGFYQSTAFALESRVEMQLILTNNFGVDRSQVVAEVSYTTRTGKLIKQTVDGADFVTHTKGRFKLVIDWMDIPDCQQDVTIVFKDTNGNELATVTESVMSALGYYSELLSNDPLYPALIKFINAATAYFAG